MENIRILFTGVGRRVELLQAFRQAAQYLQVHLKIYSADMAGTAPALAFCDETRKICAMTDADYIPQLLDICQKDKIDLIVPTIDTDLLVLAAHAERFQAAGTKVLISSRDKIAVCRDKNYTSDFFISCGLKAPKPVNDYQKYTGSFPCFIKPKDGSSSINAFKVEQESELAVYAEKIGDYIIQPFIEGTEYTVDIFCDFEGNPIFIIPRIRLAVRAGEVLKTKIDLDEKIIEESGRLIDKFKPCGPITVQLIRQNETGEDYYIEINPRYGGGAPLSMKAGADSPQMLIRLLRGEKIGYQTEHIWDGAVYSRFDQSVCIDSESGRPWDREDGAWNVKGVIFDLDDTLYSEKQYIRSGYHAVAKYLDDEAAEDRLWEHFLEGKNAIDELLRESGCLDKKPKCLEIYREHMPELTLYQGVSNLIQRLKAAGIRVGIITDGRISGQKNKIAALGLDNLVEDIIITDEIGGEQFRKPNDIAFRIMQGRWRLPYSEMVYVGDNPGKDFQAPRQLGMKSIYFDNADGLYGQEAVTENAYGRKIENILDVYEVAK
ncbi:MAG: ATP-grasp domain-containing protein [Muribaculaceae bacterium]|nr:ATP-grasp domain-containing protein [Muribaculaceae bacterium]